MHSSFPLYIFFIILQVFIYKCWTSLKHCKQMQKQTLTWGMNVHSCSCRAIPGSYHDSCCVLISLITWYTSSMLTFQSGNWLKKASTSNKYHFQHLYISVIKHKEDDTGFYLLFPIHLTVWKGFFIYLKNLIFFFYGSIFLFLVCLFLHNCVINYCWANIPVTIILEQS